MAWDVHGKTILLTGATSGIGLEAAVALARRGARLVLVGRDPERTEAAVADVKARGGAADVSHLLCDFSSQAEIRRLAAAVLAHHDRLDVLVNNAGAVNKDRRLTVDGIERTFAVNHLGYFLLTNLLLDLLKKSAPSRIVNTASVGHRRGRIDFDDLQMEKGYSVIDSYSRSKLANVYFTRELARRLEGTGVTANCIGPGPIATRIWSKAPWFTRPFFFAASVFMTSAEEGGSLLVHLAAEIEADKTGGYYEHKKLTWPSRLAQDDAIAKRLWDESAKLTKLA